MILSIKFSKLKNFYVPNPVVLNTLVPYLIKNHNLINLIQYLFNIKLLNSIKTNNLKTLNSFFIYNSLLYNFKLVNYSKIIIKVFYPLLYFKKLNQKKFFFINKWNYKNWKQKLFIKNYNKKKLTSNYKASNIMNFKYNLKKKTTLNYKNHKNNNLIPSELKIKNSFKKNQNKKMFIFRKNYNFFLKTRNKLINKLINKWLTIYRTSTTFIFNFKKINRIKFDYLNFNSPFQYKRLLTIFKQKNPKTPLFRRNPKQYWVSKITHVTLIKPRKNLVYYWNIKFRYQKKITKFLLIFYRLKNYEYFKYEEFKIESLLKKNLFIISDNWMSYFFNKSYIFLNGYPVKNLKLTVSHYDLIQLPIAKSIFILWRFQTSFEHLSLVKFKKFVYKYRIKSRRQFPKKPSFRIPNWVRYLTTRHELLPLYCEVDFLTLSIVILKLNYYKFFMYNFMTWNSTVFNNFKGFNWKYLT